MRRWLVSTTLVFFVVVLLSFTLLAENKLPIGTFRPFTVNLLQQQPVSMTISVPVDNKMITATVPLTVDVNLQIKISGTGNVSVVMLDTKPATTQVQFDSQEIDRLGIPFSVQLPEGIEIVEWNTYDTGDALQLLGKLKNTSIGRRFSLVDFSFHFYNEDGQLIDTNTVSASGRWVDPGKTLPFEFNNLARIGRFERYEVTVEVVDWTTVH